MTRPTYSVNGYQIKLRTSRSLHILVEGSDDSRALSCLLDEMAVAVPGLHPIEVDVSELLRDEEVPGLGAREKVEHYCHRLATTKVKTRFAGLTDREHRLFNLDNGIVDECGPNLTNDRLVWTHGHSIENYFFTFPVLRSAFRSLAPVPQFEEVAALFEHRLHATLISAAALSIAGSRLEKLSMVRGSIDWQTIDIDGRKGIIDLKAWNEVLRKRLSCDAYEATSLMSAYTDWVERLIEEHDRTLRLVCHGHVGLELVWATYIACVVGFGNDPSIVTRDKKLRFNACAHAWAQEAIAKRAPWPRDVFLLLNTPI